MIMPIRSTPGGPSFFPSIASKILNLGGGASIANVDCHYTPSLTSLNSLSFVSVLDWLQASITALVGEDYIRGLICTHRDLVVASPQRGSFQANLVTAHLRQRFPGHFKPPLLPPPLIQISQYPRVPGHTRRGLTSQSFKCTKESATEVPPPRGDVPKATDTLRKTKGHSRHSAMKRN